METPQTVRNRSDCDDVTIVTAGGEEAASHPKIHPLSPPALTKIRRTASLRPCPRCLSGDVETVARRHEAREHVAAPMPGWGWAVRCDHCGFLGPVRPTAQLARIDWNTAKRAA